MKKPWYVILLTNPCEHPKPVPYVIQLPWRVTEDVVGDIESWVESDCGRGEVIETEEQLVDMCEMFLSDSDELDVLLLKSTVDRDDDGDTGFVELINMNAHYRPRGDDE